MSQRPRTTLPSWLRTAVRHGVVWARQYYGRTYHAKLEETARAGICGRTPDRDGKRGRWWAYSVGKPPASALCPHCVELIRQAAEVTV